MYRYILRRLIQMGVTLLLLSVVIFLLARLLGDPIAFMLPLEASEEDVARMIALLGFDQPLHVQYLRFLGDLLQGDLGMSVRQQQPVADIVMSRLWPSILLAGVSVAWALMASLVLGTLAALNRGTPIDRLANIVATIGQASPSFWVGLVLVQAFSVQLGWLPAAGFDEPATLILPTLTLGLVALVGLTRLVRSSLIEALGTDYIVKARVMGIPRWRVTLLHGLRNALLPVVTYAGELFAILIGSSVAVEVVFAWPGIGRLAYEAVFTRDYPLIQGVVIVTAVIVMVVNLLVDLLYAYLDPRVRYD